MIKLPFVLLLTVAITGCASQQKFIDEVEAPETEVTRLVEIELAGIQAGEYCRQDPLSQFNGCDGALQRLTQLFTRFPDYERLQLALAVAYQARNRNREAQYYLDLLLNKDRPRPEAAILAARLAMEEGNTRRALTLLKAQKRLNPMHPGIHEALGAVYYLNHQPRYGFTALASAEQLGAPAWRVAYHRGLLYELTKNESAACEQYAKSYTLKRSFGLPEGRILGLTHNPICLELAKYLGGA